jgi:hypothetical protein
MALAHGYLSLLSGIFQWSRSSRYLLVAKALETFAYINATGIW